MLIATGNNAYHTQQKNSEISSHENGRLFKVVVMEKKVQSHIVLCFIHPFENHLPHKVPIREGSKNKRAMLILIIVQILSMRKYTRP